MSTISSVYYILSDIYGLISSSQKECSDMVNSIFNRYNKRYYAVEYKFNSISNKHPVIPTISSINFSPHKINTFINDEKNQTKEKHDPYKYLSVNQLYKLTYKKDIIQRIQNLDLSLFEELEIMYSVEYEEYNLSNTDVIIFIKNSGVMLATISRDMDIPSLYYNHILQTYKILNYYIEVKHDQLFSKYFEQFKIECIEIWNRFDISANGIIIIELNNHCIIIHLPRLLHYVSSNIEYNKYMHPTFMFAHEYYGFDLEIINRDIPYSLSFLFNNNKSRLEYEENSDKVLEFHKLNVINNNCWKYFHDNSTSFVCRVNLLQSTVQREIEIYEKYMHDYQNISTELAFETIKLYMITNDITFIVNDYLRKIWY